MTGVVHLDTSVLIAALTADRPLAKSFRDEIAGGTRMVVSALVVFEYVRGPRSDAETREFRQLFTDVDRVAFGDLEAAAAAALYRVLERPRGREMDICIAASAITHGARLWSINAKDFADIPGLRLIR
jgi:predicted nucleic acid-binding protein